MKTYIWDGAINITVIKVMTMFSTCKLTMNSLGCLALGLPVLQRQVYRFSTYKFRFTNITMETKAEIIPSNNQNYFD